MHARCRSVSAVALVFAVAAAACSSSGEPAPTASTTTSTTLIELDLEPATAAVVSFGDDVPGSRHDELTEWVADLRGAAELVRGLRFLDEPEIRFLSREAADELWELRQQRAIDPSDLAVDTRFLQLLGVLDPQQSLRAIIAPAFETAPAAFFDTVENQIVISTPSEEPTPTEGAAAVAAIVVGLTDQYHRHSERIAGFQTEALLDEADALRGLVAADAAYFSLIYAQEVGAVVDGAPVASLPARVPAAVADVLAFPYEAGIEFVRTVVESGGIAGLDRAYGVAPLTTEDLLHPERWGLHDPHDPVGPSPLALTGYRLHRTGTLGELGLRVLLAEAQTPGLVRQAVDGWGADHFATFTSGNDVAWVYLYRGDSVEDTVEVAQAFLDLAAGAMNLNEPVAVGGGVEISGPRLEEGEEAPTEPRGPYVFVDRDGDGLVVVIAHQIDAGRRLAASVEIP